MLDITTCRSQRSRLIRVRRSRREHAILLALLAWPLALAAEDTALPSPGGPFEYAVRLHSDQAFEDARGRFERLAGLGFAEAQRNLAVMLVKGEGGDRDLTSAYAWLAVAAQQNDPQAKVLQPKALALLGSESERAEAQERADQWRQRYTLDAVMRELEPDYSTKSERAVSRESLDGIRKVIRVPPAYPPDLARRSIEGSALLQFVLPNHGHPRDLRLISSAHGDFTAASAAVLPNWRFTLEDDARDRLYSQRFIYTMPGSNRFEQAAKEQVELLQSKAQSGDVGAMYQLGWVLDALPVDENTLTKAQSLRWLHASALAGLRDAAFDMNTRLRDGVGCVRDKTKATRWEDVAAGLKQPDALRALADTRLQAGDQREALYYIKGAAASSGRPTDTARLAWVLATVELGHERQGPRALDLIDSIESTYLDRAAWHEIRAAALAETGQWDAAVDEQRDAIKALRRYQVPLAPAKARLDEYREQRPLRLPLDSTPF